MRKPNDVCTNMRNLLGVFIALINVKRVEAHSAVGAHSADRTPVFDDKSSKQHPWALLVDAGSTGTRLHLFEWRTRVFDTLPPPLSIPLTSSMWTVKGVDNGISSIGLDSEKIPSLVRKTLDPLMEFAKDQLRHSEKDWGKFPVFLKATAGMRCLPPTHRDAIIDAVRNYFSNKNSCPFLFESLEQV